MLRKLHRLFSADTINSRSGKTGTQGGRADQEGGGALPGVEVRIGSTKCEKIDLMPWRRHAAASVPASSHRHCAQGRAPT
eukprot:scaffold2163_cov120-Isochrysis_galbana.AAC.3